MDLDTYFVTALCKEGRGAIRDAISKGIDASFLSGSSQGIYQFLLDYVKKYDGDPTQDMVEGRTGVKLPLPAAAPCEFFTDEVINRRLHGVIGEQLELITAHHTKSRPVEAYRAYEEGLRVLRDSGVAVARTISLPSLGPEFLIYYEKLEAGHTGILTPWPSVNEATMGFWPGDFVLYVARLGIGKTQVLTLLMDYAWAVQKKRVLFVTTEMTQEKIVQRWIGVHYKLPYTQLTHGKLGMFVKKKMVEGIELIKNEEGLYIIGGDFDFRIESLEAAIEDCEPEAVFVDGAYLLKTEGSKRTERAANSFDELKRCAKRNDVPLIASTQFNREVKGNKLNSAGAEKIALSDAAGWNADLIYGLIQTEDMKKDRRMIQRPLKFREGLAEDVECWWDFETMNFSELPKGPAAAAVGGSGGGSAGGRGGASGAPGGGSGAARPDSDPYGSGLLNFNTESGAEGDGGDIPY